MGAEKLVLVVQVAEDGTKLKRVMPEPLAREFCCEHPGSFLVNDLRVSSQTKKGGDMTFDPSNLIVLIPGQRGMGEFIAFETKAQVDKYLTEHPEAVLARFNVGASGNNNPADTYDEAQKLLQSVKVRDPQACITMMVPHRELKGALQGKYYQALSLFQ